MSHSDQYSPADWPELVITGTGLSVDQATASGSTPDLPVKLLPGAVWLAPDACLILSHLDQPEDAPQVINVVGLANCDDLACWVLMLG